MAGCRLDMHTQPKVLPLTKSDFFEDGRGSRALVPGTIARGQLRADAYLYTGMINGKPGDFMPFPATREVLERGRERFNVYCSPCHSRMGDGNGIVVQRGFRHPPSFHTQALRTAPLDYPHYLERQLAPALDVVLKLLSTSFEREAGEQLSLF